MSADRSDPTRWVTLTALTAGPRAQAPVRSSRVYAQVVVLTLVVLVAVALVGSYAARSEAEKESVAAASQRAETLAGAVIEPALLDGIVEGDPAAEAALDQEVRDHVLGPTIVRVKLWRPDGTVVYSDEPRLVGRRFDLDDEELAVMTGGPGGAEVTDLEEPENVFERGQGKLLEVYRPVSTPDGEVLLFETYAPYDVVTTRGNAIWRGFVVITIGSLLALLLMMLPILWRLLGRLRREQEQREGLLQSALDASDAERRRIAATLHDGVVQELAATSFVVSGAANRAASAGETELAGALEEAGSAVRTGIGGLRSLLVDIYPASLADTGLVPALDDLLAGLRSRRAELVLDAAPDAAAGLTTAQSQLVFRVAQECLRNTARHGQATRVGVALRREEHAVVLEIEDDGVGFDVAGVLAHPARGHFGVRLLVDASRQAGAGLAVRSAAGAGTHWRLEVPV